MEKAKKFLSKVLKNKGILTWIAFIAVMVAMILVASFALGVPLVAVCTLAILEALLAALLNQIPLWVHGLFVIAQIIGGVLFGKIVLMLLMSVIYVAAVALLYVWSLLGKKNGVAPQA